MIIINVIILTLITGIVIFIFIYRKRRLLHKQELTTMQWETRLETTQTISREIHDSVTQKFTLASIYLRQLEVQGKEEFPAPALAKISTVLDSALAELRDLSHALSHPETIEQDLAEVLHQEARLVEDTGVKVTLDVQADAGMPIAMKFNIQRVVQEFFQNSLKHGACTAIDLDLRYDKEYIHLTIQDNGKGFDTKASLPGIGISNIQRRISAMQGSVEVSGMPGKGTRLKATIPFTRKPSP
jgi:signal transduction histidine kinase